MLTTSVIDRAVSAALEEDAPWGDITSEILIPETSTARADLIAREPGVFSGGEVFAAAFRLTDPAIDVQLMVETATRSRRAPYSRSSPAPPAAC